MRSSASVCDRPAAKLNHPVTRPATPGAHVAPKTAEGPAEDQAASMWTPMTFVAVVTIVLLEFSLIGLGLGLAAHAEGWWPFGGHVATSASATPSASPTQYPVMANQPAATREPTRRWSPSGSPSASASPSVSPSVTGAPSVAPSATGVVGSTAPTMAAHGLPAGTESPTGGTTSAPSGTPASSAAHSPAP